MITMTYKNNYRHIIYVKVSNELKNNTVHLKNIYISNTNRLINNKYNFNMIYFSYHTCSL